MRVRLTKRLVEAIRREVPEVDEHDLKAIVACLSVSPTERARRLDEERWMLMKLRGIGKEEKVRYFKTAKSYQRWLNQQPDVGGWEWQCLLDRLAGRRPYPRASRK